MLRMYRLDSLRKLKSLAWLEPGSNDHYLALKLKRAYNYNLYNNFCPNNMMVNRDKRERFHDSGADFSDELFEMSRDYLMNLDYKDDKLFEF